MINGRECKIGKLESLGEKSNSPVLGLLQDVTQDKDIRNTSVTAWLKTSLVISHPNLLTDTNTRLRDTSDDTNKSREGNRDERVTVLSLSVNSDNSVVGKWTRTKVQSTQLNKSITRWSGLAPSTISGTSHANQLRKHVDLLNGTSPFSSIAVGVWNAVERITHTISHSLNLIDEIGRNVLLLLFPNPRHCLLEDFRSSQGALDLDNAKDLLKWLWNRTDVNVQNLVHIELGELWADELNDFFWGEKIMTEKRESENRE